MAEAETLVYYDTATIMSIKSFIVEACGDRRMFLILGPVLFKFLQQ
jgi:hypothetical protein